jgi:hypothetical protein
MWNKVPGLSDHQHNLQCPKGNLIILPLITNL